ncbi:hypothetical protein NNX39_15175 [Arthrobacter sp. zg-Y826]|uniref:hypothetical protein n=1 Tax=Arthrobacter jinronghuae TaxID=2964609 RepID=UPI0021072A37|nr:hypothetical protein [Arthrobacter jinronghuae]MCQ1957836.1 hypothetical protein [Arthrobacter jinronghuae]
MSLSTSRVGIVADLLSYGEDAAAQWAWEAPQEVLEEVLTVASWVLYNGPGPADGSSMLISKAVALAGIYVHESRPRELHRKRRDLKLYAATVANDTPYAQERFLGSDDYDAVGPDARSYWGQQQLPQAST